MEKSVRITRDEWFMGVALLTSKRSTCLRSRVGAVIVRDKRIISTGYNGSPVGMPHCTPNTCNSARRCLNTIHAEANAIAFAAKGGIPLEGTKLYCTLSPCKTCSEMIIQSGIKEVIYMHEYGNDFGLELLRQAKIIVRQYVTNIL